MAALGKNIGMPPTWLPVHLESLILVEVRRYDCPLCVLHVFKSPFLLCHCPFIVKGVHPGNKAYIYSLNMGVRLLLASEAGLASLRPHPQM